MPLTLGPLIIRSRPALLNFRNLFPRRSTPHYGHIPLPWVRQYFWADVFVWLQLFSGCGGVWLYCVAGGSRFGNRASHYAGVYWIQAWAETQRKLRLKRAFHRVWTRLYHRGVHGAGMRVRPVNWWLACGNYYRAYAYFDMYWTAVWSVDEFDSRDLCVGGSMVSTSCWRYWFASQRAVFFMGKKSSLQTGTLP